MIFFIMSILVVVVLSACGGDESSDPADELLALEVDFIVPEQVDVGETVELLAEVTYGEELETDAVVRFEIWEQEDEERENSIMLEAENNGDGTYTAEHTFDQEGIYEMYAHTDANNLHTMPKKQIIVGDSE